MRELLELLEAGPGDNLLPGLAWLAGQDVELDPDEVKATLRRAELLLAAGGDPHRELELDGRAVPRSRTISTTRLRVTSSRTRSPDSPPPRKG